MDPYPACDCKVFSVEVAFKSTNPLGAQLGIAVI